MDDRQDFQRAVIEEIKAQGQDSGLLEKTREWFGAAGAAKYSYHFSAFGLPIIQFPQDMVAVQELIWDVKPDLIIETGIARGGSLLWSAGLLALLEYTEAASTGRAINPSYPRRKVIGIDIDIRPHNRIAIEAHPLSRHVEMIEGSSISPSVVSQVRARAAQFERVLVMLDSNHTHEHVLSELEGYAQLVSAGSYCVVFDTVIENTPKEAFPNRPWGPGNSPMTAVNAYLAHHPEFSVDTTWDDKLLISVAPRGYLLRS